jgi:maltose alpha-D-glucosyltransferase/alpha-amylase
VSERWYKQAVIYSLDVDTFQDANGDGIGDFAGLTARLDYLSRLGVTCLWLNPIHPTPNRDDGYDVMDYYGVDPRLGTLGDFTDFLHEAGNRGLRVIIDLVVNHTSDQHPWFRSARSSPDSPYRDWYVWSTEEPPDRFQGMVFPGEQRETWTWDEQAGAWYYHRFYEFQPDLNIENPAVRAEIGRIARFWLHLGVSGFRMDAAPFVIERTRPGQPEGELDFGFLEELHDTMAWRRGDVLVLAEANVARDALPAYFGDGRRLPMLFNFLLNQRMFLALARGDASPIVAGLEASPTLAPACQWATFLRNHDEVDLGRLGEREREEVFAAFGPEPAMRLYDRGIRRRLAPMLDGDQRRLRLAYALQCTLPGTPVLRYGDEIGMGDDLSLPERNAIRTPMQWSAQRNAGFSDADPTCLVRPVVTGGPFGYETVNVVHQRRAPGSLLRWMEQMLRTLRECPEFGTGTCEPVDVGEPSVLVLVHTAPTGAMAVFANLGPDPVTVDASSVATGHAIEIFRDTPLSEDESGADDEYEEVEPSLAAVSLRGYGFRWIRIGWSIPTTPIPASRLLEQAPAARPPRATCAARPARRRRTGSGR